MRISYYIAISFGMKLVMLLFCFTLLLTSRLFAQKYFDPSLSRGEYQRAVNEATNLNQYKDGITGLMQATINGKLDLAKLLLKYGANINLKARNREGHTALHYGVANMQFPSVEPVVNLLIDKYADPKIKNKHGDTPLHLVPGNTTQNARTQQLISLVKNGGNINAQNNEGNTVAHVAVTFQSGQWLASLMEQFGPLIDMSIKNNKGFTPEEFARELGFIDLADRIKSTAQPPFPGAEKFGSLGLTGLHLAIIQGNMNSFSSMIQNKKALNMQSEDEYGNTPLHLAILFARAGMLQKLLKAGANPLVKNKKGRTPASFLVRVTSSPAHRGLTRQIITKAPQAILEQDSHGENLAHLAVRFNDVRLFDFLKQNFSKKLDAALRVKNKKYQTPLALARQMRRADLVQKIQGMKKLGFSI